VVTVLLGFLFGFLQFGWLLNRYTVVVNAAGVGVRYLASRNFPDGDLNVYAQTRTVVLAAAPSIPATSLAVSMTVNGANCTDSTTDTCEELINNHDNFGTQATVTVTWTITPWMNVRIFGLNNLWPSSYSATVAERIYEG